MTGVPGCLACRGSGTAWAAGCIPVPCGCDETGPRCGHCDEPTCWDGDTWCCDCDTTGETPT